jgi:hypothetical protein
MGSAGGLRLRDAAASFRLWWSRSQMKRKMNGTMKIAKVPATQASHAMHRNGTSRWNAN